MARQKRPGYGVALFVQDAAQQSHFGGSGAESVREKHAHRAAGPEEGVAFQLRVDNHDAVIVSPAATWQAQSLHQQKCGERPCGQYDKICL